MLLSGLRVWLVSGTQQLRSRRLGPALARGISVTLRVRARRLFCDEASCERRIFCERLPEIAARVRKTGRLEEALLAIVFEVGGRAGARLAAELGLVVGRDALLSRARRAAPAQVGKVRVLWASTTSPSGRAKPTARSWSIWRGARWWTSCPSVPNKA